MDKRRQLGAGMWLVIFSKAAAALLLLLAFALLIAAGAKDPTDVVSKLLGTLFKGNPPDIVISFAVSSSAGLTSTRAYRLAAATLAYAILETTEAIGLARRKRWAEWLTILVTASLIPLEAYELAKEFTPIKAATLAVNLAILVFLVVRRVKEHHDESGWHRRPLAVFAPS
jgi:uncharacterized membrane protein (DUF2068 family)